MQLWDGPDLKQLTRTRRHERITATRNSIPGIITTSRMEQLYKFQCGSCYLCFRKFSDTLRATREHVIPKALGGTNHRNVMLACSPCNNEKADRSPTQRELDICAAFYALDSAETDD